ncbi:hypothetical protein PENSPDRAFT_754419 [Peniophora sp. CONT]|nr:hypothetical protein PENSPDRAFT_754419 [Peniophora sp. CONT]
MQHQQINKYIGRPMTDGVPNSNQPTLKRDTLPSYYSQESGPNTQEPTPLYDVQYSCLEARIPPSLSFFDQFSAPGSTARQVDIFWVDSNSFIICSAQALDRFRGMVNAHKGLGPWRLCDLIANLFMRHGTSGTGSKYLGIFEMTWVPRRTMRLSDTDLHGSAAALRAACGQDGSEWWQAAPGIRELCAGREAQVHWIHVKYVKDDAELMGALKPIGWIRPAASLRPSSSVKSLPSTATIFSPMY